MQGKKCNFSSTPTWAPHTVYFHICLKEMTYTMKLPEQSLLLLSALRNPLQVTAKSNCRLLLALKKLVSNIPHRVTHTTFQK